MKTPFLLVMCLFSSVFSPPWGLPTFVKVFSTCGPVAPQTPHFNLVILDSIPLFCLLPPTQGMYSSPTLPQVNGFSCPLVWGLAGCSRGEFGIAGRGWVGVGCSQVTRNSYMLVTTLRTSGPRDHFYHEWFYWWRFQTWQLGRARAWWLEK